MKPSPSKPNFSALSLTAVSVLLAAGWLVPSAAPAQVRIPAKSGSSLDDSAEDSVSSDLPAPGGTGIRSQSNVSRTAPAGPSQVKPPSAPLPKPGAVTAVQRVEMPKQNLNPERMKRLAELRRELRISETATRAKMSLPADELFEATAPTTIDDLSEPSLRLIAEYLELVEFQKVTVKPFFVPDQQGGKELSWSRSLSLIEWMKANTGLEPDHFQAAGPEPVVEATPKKVSRNVGETEFVNRIELHFE